MRSYNIMRQLSRVFDITALCFYRTDLVEDRLERSIDGLRSIAEVEAFAIPQEHSSVRLVWDHVRSAFKGDVYTRFVYESHAFREALNEALGTRDYDLVHADSLDMSAYFKSVDDQKLVCVHHNVESDLLKRRSENASTPLSRLYLLYQAKLMEREEQKWCPRVNLNVTVSEQDRDTLRERTNAGRFTVVPNGIDIEYFSPEGGQKRIDIVSVGGVEWYPNRDALDYFCEYILGNIRKSHPDVSVQWIGRCPEDLKTFYSERYGISLTGYVDDVRPYLTEASCFAAPLRVGGGTRLKILTAWAMGVPVVSTSLGAEGLEAEDGHNILIRDEPVAFAEGIERILGDEDLRRKLSTNGRVTVEDMYSWSAIGDKMLKEYKALL